MDGVKVGLIGGSGLGEAMLARAGDARRHEVDTPFGPPSDAILETQLGGLPVFLLSRHGPGHVHGPAQVPFRANVFALKKLGVTHVIASGAVGSLRESFRPRDLVIPDQVIDKTSRRAGTFFERSAVHVEFSEPFCPVMRRILLEAGSQGSGSGVRGQESAASAPAPDSRPLTPAYAVHDRGCYVCMEGPAFSTRAESLMHRLWGGDLIGMTAMPEAKLAREAELGYALVALVTDYDCWRTVPAGTAKPAADAPPADPSVLLQEIIANLRAASDNTVDLITRALPRLAARQEELLAAPARQALRLAIWSDKQRIPREEVETLAPLWGKYFEG
jgi:5'-methylthioadenosine phosphorylase